MIEGEKRIKDIEEGKIDRNQMVGEIEAGAIEWMKIWVQDGEKGEREWIEFPIPNSVVAFFRMDGLSRFLYRVGTDDKNEALVLEAMQAVKEVMRKDNDKWGVEELKTLKKEILDDKLIEIKEDKNDRIS